MIKILYLKATLIPIRVTIGIAFSRRRLMRLQTFNVVDAIIIFSLPARLDGLGFIDRTDHPLHFFVLSSV